MCGVRVGLFLELEYCNHGGTIMGTFEGGLSGFPGGQEDLSLICL